MKIWIDITNSPHVLFFKPIIDELKKDNEIIITTREHAQTVDLLKMYGIEYTIVGEHAGRSKFKKAFELFARMNNLYKFVKNKKPDVVVVHQSPYAIIPALLLGVKKRIFIFDNETAFFQNMMAIPFSTHALCPEALTSKRMFLKKLTKYSGIKESVYITKPNVKQHKQILMRPEPWSAAYYHEGEDVLGPIIESLYNKWKIVLLPRDKKQKEYYAKKFRNKVVIPEKVNDGAELICSSSIVIGAGGTMNREAVVLGVPVISTYKGKLLAVDRWLIKEGLMHHNQNITPEFVENCIKKHKTTKFKSALRDILGVINENN